MPQEEILNISKQNNIEAVGKEQEQHVSDEFFKKDLKR